MYISLDCEILIVSCVQGRRYSIIYSKYIEKSRMKKKKGKILTMTILVFTITVNQSLRAFEVYRHIIQSRYKIELLSQDIWIKIRRSHADQTVQALPRRKQ